MTRIYTPDATGRCTVCARPEAEHSRSGGWEGDEARCMPDHVVEERPIREHQGYRLDGKGRWFVRCHHHGWHPITPDHIPEAIKRTLNGGTL